MRRREFIVALGTAAVWPLGAQGQQAVRRIGVLLGFGENDPASKVYISAFTRGLAEFGWTDGRNVGMDVRFAAGDVDRMQIFAKELVGFKPDVILTQTTPATGAVQRETQTIPIVFVNVADPVGSGYVASLPHPGGNLTGFAQWEPTIASKWVELLTEIAPGFKRIATIFNPETAPFVRSYFLPSFEATTRAFKVESIVVPIHSSAEIETIINSLGREPRSGLVVMPDTFTDLHRALIISLAARNNVPAVYPYPYFAKEGGLLSYGTDYMGIFYRFGLLYRSHSPWRKAGGPSSSTAGHISDDHQQKDRQGARPRSASLAARPRRRGDRVSAPGKAGAIQPVKVRPK